MKPVVKALIILDISVLFIVLAARFIPIASKDFVYGCTPPPQSYETRYTILNKQAYDSAPRYYEAPGDETKDCATHQDKIKLYIL